MVKTMVDRSRLWLQHETHREHVPFITVGHDGWDSKDKDMLGVCCHFVDMDRGKLRTIALGLQQAYSKKSVDTAQHTLKMLERYVLWLLCGARGEALVILLITHLLCANYRYGIHQNDIFRAVNDTASPAIAAGKLIADGRVPNGGTTCQMHAVELVLKHSLGLLDRRKDGAVSDSFQEGKDLRDLCRDLASKVMDKKAKGRFHEFEQLSLKIFHVKPIKLKTPNATRVAGDYILLVSLLRAKSLLQVLMGESSYTAVYKNYIIASEQWKTIAEFEAVMNHIHHLAMTSQCNEPGEIAFSWFELSMCWMNTRTRLTRGTMLWMSPIPGPLTQPLRNSLL